MAQAHGLRISHLERRPHMMIVTYRASSAGITASYLHNHLLKQSEAEIQDNILKTIHYTLTYNQQVESTLTPPEVTTGEALATFLMALSHRIKSSRSLEEYLRALWQLAQGYQHTPLTFSLIAQLFETALTAEPAPFENEWLALYQQPPHLPKEYTEREFAYFQHMILFQIADLHRMKNAGMLDKPGHILWLGVESPTGQTWYNVGIAGFIHQSAYAIQHPGWIAMGELLYSGQTYE